MWQIYIYDEDGKLKPYLKSWKDLESATKFADKVLETCYTIKNVSEQSDDVMS